MLSTGYQKKCSAIRGLLVVLCLAGSAVIYGAEPIFAEALVDVAPWLDSRNQQEWRLLSFGARWQVAGKICRDAKMRLPRIDTLQDAQMHLINVSAGQKALEVSELIWSADSWNDSSGSRPSAVAMSMRSGENTSVGKDNRLPVICVRDLPTR